jgi:dTDP-4-dehydrorhamnose reductase
MFLRKVMNAMQTRTKFLILGANGQVGQALNAAISNPNVVILGREQADFSKPETLYDVIEAINPEYLFNAVAYTAVDKAESEESLATTINADAVRVLAQYAKNKDIPLVHYSTDYVFDGKGDNARTEDAPTNPLNAYGRSKLAGEKAIADVGCKHLIFRTSWVYDAYGKNFLNTMLKFGAEREEMRVVADQIGAPTYAPHIADASLLALKHALDMPEFPSGIYHLCNAGETSWHGFAEAIFAGANKRGAELKVQRVLPIPASDYPTPAARPSNSRLNCAKLRDVLGVTLPDWHVGLEGALDEKTF